MVANPYPIKSGNLKLEITREKAEEALGDKFDIKRIFMRSSWNKEQSPYHLERRGNQVYINRVRNKN
jgi:hypothetical protein